MFQTHIIFLFKSWNQLFHQGALAVFTRGEHLGTKVWVLGMLVLPGVILGPLRGQGWEGHALRVWTRTRTCMCAHIRHKHVVHTSVNYVIIHRYLPT